MTARQSAVLMQPDLLRELPAVLLPIICSYLTVRDKLCSWSLLSRHYHAQLTALCFTSNHVHLTNPLLLVLQQPSSPLPQLLSAVQSLSFTALTAVEPEPSFSGTVAPLFPDLQFYSQQVTGRGFPCPSFISHYQRLQQLQLDTGCYSVDITFALSPSLTALHSVKLRALLTLSHVDAILSLPALQHLDLTGSSVINAAGGQDIFPSDSLTASPLAASALPRLHTLCLPVGEQLLSAICKLVSSSSPPCLRYLRIDESPVSDACVRSLLALPSLTALELHRHTVQWSSAPWQTLADSEAPPPSSSLRHLRFRGDHEAPTPVLPHAALLASMQGCLSRFQHLSSLDMSLPAQLRVSEIFSALLAMPGLQSLTLSRRSSNLAAGWPAPEPPCLHPASPLPSAWPCLPLLRRLSLSDLDDAAEDEVLLLLSQAPALTSCTFSYCNQVTVAVLPWLSSRCPELRWLLVSHCLAFALTDAGLDRGDRQTAVPGRLPPTPSSRRCHSPS